jgi:hypothetical protein
MRRVSSAVILLALGTAVAMTVVVATAPNDYPTATDSLWGRAMPHTQAGIDLVLLLASAILVGIAVFIRLNSRRVPAAVMATIASGSVLYLLSVVAWRLHAPVSAGNGG